MARTRGTASAQSVDQVVHVAAYVRVSTEDQHESGLGLEDQRRRCCAMASMKGWAEPTMFGDAGVSGTLETAKRPELAKLMAAVRAHEVDVVIVSSLDRFSRKVRLTLELVEEFDKHKVTLVSCKDSIDTTTPNGQFFVTMLAAMAQLERELSIPSQYHYHQGIGREQVGQVIIPPGDHSK